MNTGENRRLDRIRGGMFGVAVGDALGGTTEFMSRDEIKRVYGYLTEIIGGGVWQLAPGEVTDDTMMTLCVAEGILANAADPISHIGERFMDWYRSKPKDIGNIIRAVFQRYEGDWLEAAFVTDMDMNGMSAGNGSLMRCMPVGLLYKDRSELERISRLQSKMTHYDERCNLACEMYNRMVFRLLQGEELSEAVTAEIRGTPYERLLTEEPGCEPSGFVVHSFNWVIRISLHCESFADAVQQAANLGGDTDTIAAITGGLVGVYYGYSGIPSDYADKILIKDRLEELALRIYEAREKS